MPMPSECPPRSTEAKLWRKCCAICHLAKSWPSADTIAGCESEFPTFSCREQITRIFTAGATRVGRRHGQKSKDRFGHARVGSAMAEDRRHSMTGNSLILQERDRKLLNE